MNQVGVAVSGVIRSEPGQRWLVVAPMCHAAAALTTFCCIYWTGACFIYDDFVPAEVNRALSAERITRAMLAPAMIQACLVMDKGVAERRYPDLQPIT